jgi:GTP-binding protein Era
MLIPTASPEFKSGFVALVGRPNVGKSTLMNALIGQKIAITSPVPQTTRNRLKGILTLDQAQIILVDTPGIHKPHHLLGEVIVGNAKRAIESVDLVVWLVDSNVKLGKGDRFIADLIQKAGTPVLVGLNKIDQIISAEVEQVDRTDQVGKVELENGLEPVKKVDRPLLAKHKEHLAKIENPQNLENPESLENTENLKDTGDRADFPHIDLSLLDQSETCRSYLDYAATLGWETIKFSALTQQGLDQLQATICDRLEPGPYYYPPDLVTDQPERFIMGELIREQILLLTREEVPHSVAVGIDRVDEQEHVTIVMATIYVERKSQKGILIGKGGQMLKQIGSEARQQIQKMIMGKVHLELFVKVQSKWRSSRTQLMDLGYRSDKR